MQGNDLEMTTLLEEVGRYQPFTAMVVGDFMLDQRLYGAAERLSPDAPVPVLHADHTDESPGGAGNVARCIHGLKGMALCAGVIGDDADGRLLAKRLSEEGCETTGLSPIRLRPTTVKRSLIGLAQHRHPQKMFRLDYESRAPIPPAVTERLLAWIESNLSRVDVLCLEDYNKGVVHPEFARRLIALCRRQKKPVLVDPAAIDDYAKYRGATAITPNRSEAELATGLDTPLDASDLHNSALASQLKVALDLDAVVLTLDRHGALLEERDGKPVHVPTVARSVYDVTGAGDMVLAALAGARANRFSWRHAVEFANAAAGLEVEVFGAQPIPFSRIQREILRLARPLEGKMRAVDEVLIEIAVRREAGQRIVFTNGCFDVIHAGHVGYLREARAQGDVLIVAINSDEQVSRLKGPGRPVNTLADRAIVLSELQCVDYVVPFDTPTVHDLLRAVRPDIYVKGGDYRREEVREYDLIRELGIDIRLLAHRPGLSTTEVLRRVREASR